MELGAILKIKQLRYIALNCPENIILIFQPPHSLELNLIERLQQFLKRGWKGEKFPYLDALQQRVNQELEQSATEEVQSLTAFNFILDALLRAAF